MKVAGISVKKQAFGGILLKMVLIFKKILLLLRPVRVNEFLLM